MQTLEQRTGRIKVSKKAWVVRTISIIAICSFFVYTFYESVRYPPDILLLTAILVPAHSMAYLIIGWYLYKSPTVRGIFAYPEPLVSVIIPVYNQEVLIERVIAAVFRSTYKNIQVVAVNDGSSDKSFDILNKLDKEYNGKLKVIHMSKNGGKRKAVAEAVYKSNGEYMVLIDSDSIVNEQAIEEFMKAFYSDEKIGAVVGNAKVLNAKKNMLTHCQDVWYDYSFNIRKSAESYFGSVMCCSGCLAAYRKAAIINYIPYWVNARLKDSEDRELTTFVISNKSMKSWLIKWGMRRLKKMSQFDDAEDRGLTAQSLATNWKAVYVPTAIVSTEVPDSWRVFLKQQKRWKKGTLRVNMFMSLFFWRRNPVLAVLLFYVEFALMFLAPVLLIVAFVYEPLFLHNWVIPATFLVGSFVGSFVHGLDYRMRDDEAGGKTWLYKPIMNMITGFIISWIVFVAMLEFNKNNWGTR